MYKCFYEKETSDLLDIKEIFYLIDNYYLIEITLSPEVYIRQRKDLDCQLEFNWETIDMKYWQVYLTDWKSLLDVWTWRWEDELEQRIQEKGTQFNF